MSRGEPLDMDLKFEDFKQTHDMPARGQDLLETIPEEEQDKTHRWHQLWKTGSLNWVSLISDIVNYVVVPVL